MNNLEIFNHLIFIGNDIQNNVIPAKQTLAILEPYDHINRIKFTIQDSSCFSDFELIALLIGLIYVERELKWLGGSVATSRFIFDAFLKRDIGINVIDEVSSWVMLNSNNHYMPFGTQVTLGARNYSEFKRLSLNHELQRQERWNDIKTVEEEAEELRRKFKIKREYGNQCRDKKMRQELIQKLNDMSIHDQLTLISQDDLFTPSFYPTRCAKQADLKAIKLLPAEVVGNLVIQMKGKFRGPWGKFKKRLLIVHNS